MVRLVTESYRKSLVLDLNRILLTGLLDTTLSISFCYRSSPVSFINNDIFTSLNKKNKNVSIVKFYVERKISIYLIYIIFIYWLLYFFGEVKI